MIADDSSPEQLMKYIVGRWISKPLYVAAELGIVDLPAEGVRSIEVFARESQTRAPSLCRVMRALASVGIFTELDHWRFELTPMAECLKSGATRSLVLMFSSDWNDCAWERFLESVKTGGVAFDGARYAACGVA